MKYLLIFLAVLAGCKKQEPIPVHRATSNHAYYYGRDIASCPPDTDCRYGFDVYHDGPKRLEVRIYFDGSWEITEYNPIKPRNKKGQCPKGYVEIRGEKDCFDVDGALEEGKTFKGVNR